MSWTVPVRSLGGRGVEQRVRRGGRVGDRGAAGGRGRRGRAMVHGGHLAAGAAPSPSTVIAPFMPAAAWPGIEHRNDSPAAGTSTAPVAGSPGLGGDRRAVGEGDVVRGEPVLSNSTSYAPGRRHGQRPPG